MGVINNEVNKMNISAKVKSKVGALATIGGALVGGASVSAVDTSNTKQYLTKVSEYFPEQDDPMTIVKNITNVAVGVIGVVAVIMIIIGGYQYATSVGDAGKVKNAKNTIMYGIIGMVIAFLAYAIVNFVIDGLFK